MLWYYGWMDEHTDKHSCREASLFKMQGSIKLKHKPKPVHSKVAKLLRQTDKITIEKMFIRTDGRRDGHL